jgi:hypothetical protein
MLIAAAPALVLANTMAVGLGKERLATNENPEHGQHPQQLKRPDPACWTVLTTSA